MKQKPNEILVTEIGWPGGLPVRCWQTD